MSKVLLIIGIALVVAGALMFIADLLPVNFLKQSSEDSYLKIEAIKSFSLISYRLHFLVAGIVCLVAYKFKNVIGF
ncbi:hypothetical protein L1077_08805 [Pseudoalteromonas luteoviolacea]|uniref:hypothetical protein n=1 Tax=Pseudoalteromonas luteoviolacea TaxID=43657 RepID=UPI001F44F75E|nr:hypothetical protein [Pseudoalteromonas luteoviolacea]MCF6439524.1 hypothetical protein [Pseudoalteromonas luteoviolacea]